MTGIVDLGCFKWPASYLKSIAPTIAKIVVLCMTSVATVDAIISWLQTRASFAAAPLVRAPLPRLQSGYQNAFWPEILGTKKWP